MSKTKPEASTNEPGAGSRSKATDRLESGVQSLTVPEPLAEAEGLLLKAGVLMPLIGLVLVVVGWWQASGTAYVAEQVPSLISGGLLGLGFVMVGLGLFLRYSLTRLFRFWLARIIVEQQAQTDRVVAALDNIEAALREGRTGQ